MTMADGMQDGVLLCCVVYSLQRRQLTTCTEKAFNVGGCLDVASGFLCTNNHSKG